MVLSMKNTELPAVEGGTPVRKDRLPFSPPYIDNWEIESVIKVMESGWITRGPVCEEFEKRLSEYTGSPYCLVLNSATAGLFLALKAMGIGEGDEVITTPYTFAATANSVIHCGARPVFADIERDSFCISPKEIKKKVGRKTKAIIPVHFGGRPAELDEISKIADNHNLTVIEDAAHAIGACYRGRKIGSGDNIAVFSFHAVKNLTTAEGGAVALKDESLFRLLKLYSLHGQSKDAFKKLQAGGWEYDIELPGYKFNMTDIQAAIGIEQLKKLDDNIKIRKRIANRYTDFFRNYSFIKVSSCEEYNECAWHLYPILIDFTGLKIDKKHLINAIWEEGISLNVHYKPVHMMSYYNKTFGYKPEDFPVSYRVYKEEISLPIYPGMSDEDVDDVIIAFKKIFDYYYSR